MKKIYELRILQISVFLTIWTLQPKYQAAWSMCVPEARDAITSLYSQAIFSGKALKASSTSDGYQLIRFEVHKTWKGDGILKKTGGIYQPSISDLYSFTEGTEYLVFADENSQGKLIVSACSTTKPLDSAAIDVKQLDLAEHIGLFKIGLKSTSATMLPELHAFQSEEGAFYGSTIFVSVFRQSDGQLSFEFQATSGPYNPRGATWSNDVPWDHSTGDFQFYSVTPPSVYLIRGRKQEDHSLSKIDVQRWNFTKPDAPPESKVIPLSKMKSSH